MARLTPQIGASGIYELRTPFETRPLTTYTCKAIRTFDDIYKLDEDVFSIYYEPKGISENDFNLDKEAGACIITLMANNIGIEANENDLESVIYVPDTYINHFPDGSDVPYSQIVLSISLGALPDYLDLTNAKASIGDAVSAIIGVAPTVKEHRAATSGTMSQASSDTAEIGRQAAITNRTTTYSEMLRYQALYNDLLARYTTLEAAYIALNP